MARRRREDRPGALHHVFNRGIARRTMFESRADIRHFLSGVARAVHRGEIDVISYSIMTTHFHLFLRSKGDLARAMRRIQSAYSRRFNRSRKRDGPLTRGRYASRPVYSPSYVGALIAYIDRNPVSAGLVADPVDYEFGSARDYALSGGRIWLDRDTMERNTGLAPRAGTARYRAYHDFLARMDVRLDEIIESRMSRTGDESEAIEHLMQLAPDRVITWMRRKADLADGTHPGQALAPVDIVRSETDQQREAIHRMAREIGVRRDAAVATVTCALLRLLAGLSMEEVTRFGFARGSISRHAARHRQLMAERPAYAELCGHLVSRIMRSVEALLLRANGEDTLHHSRDDGEAATGDLRSERAGA